LKLPTSSRSFQRNDRILFTGGTGFFGKAILKHWLKRVSTGDGVPSVLVLTRDPERFLSANPQFQGREWLSFVQGSVTNSRDFPDGQFSHVLHAATDSTLGPSLSPLERFDQIVQGTRNTLDFAVKSGARRFLLTSSGGVYGPQPQNLERLPEDYLGIPDPLNTVNSYSIGKRVAEHLCALYAHRFGLEMVIARCFAFVGEDLPLDVHFAIGNFIRDALWGEEIVVGGNGSPIRSYLDQRDLAEWILALLVRGVPGRSYNVGSDEAISIANLATLIRDLIAPGKPIRTLKRPETGPSRNRYVPSVERAREELGLRVQIPLSQAILAVAEFHRGQSRRPRDIKSE